MAIELYWGSGSPYSWRVLLALEYKRLPYESHVLQFSKQEHKSPQMLRMNPRGRVPVLKDDDFVVFESLACLTYLDRKYPEPPLFGVSPEEAATIMRVICEYQSYAEQYLTQIVSAVFLDQLDQQARGGHTRHAHRRGRGPDDRGQAQQVRLAGRRPAFRRRPGRLPGNHASAPRDGKARGRRPAFAVPADGGHLSRDCPVD